jgi:hypothetical protein
MKNQLELLKDAAYNINKDDLYKMYEAATKQSDCSMFMYEALPGSNGFGDPKKSNKLVYMKTHRTMTCMYIAIGLVCYHIVIKCNDAKIEKILCDMYKAVTT